MVLTRTLYPLTRHYEVGEETPGLLGADLQPHGASNSCSAGLGLAPHPQGWWGRLACMGSPPEWPQWRSHVCPHAYLRPALPTSFPELRDVVLPPEQHPQTHPPGITRAAGSQANLSELFCWSPVPRVLTSEILHAAFTVGDVNFLFLLFPHPKSPILHPMDTQKHFWKDTHVSSTTTDPHLLICKAQADITHSREPFSGYQSLD